MSTRNMTCAREESKDQASMQSSRISRERLRDYNSILCNVFMEKVALSMM